MMLRHLLSLGSMAPYVIAALFVAVILGIIGLDVMIGVVGTLTLPWDAVAPAPTPAPAPAPSPTPPGPPPGCVTMPGGLLICD